VESARAARRDSSAAGRDPDSILPSAWRRFGGAHTDGCGRRARGGLQGPNSPTVSRWAAAKIDRITPPPRKQASAAEALDQPSTIGAAHAAPTREQSTEPTHGPAY
jgi:hypothetical protein